MKALKTKILFAVLSFSNLAVLGLVVQTYFSSTQSLRMFSVGDDIQDLNEKIKTQCGADVTSFNKGEKEQFTCPVKIKRKQNQASYILRTEMTVKKTKDKILISAQGAIRDKTAHAKAADFCNNCSTEIRELEANKQNPQEILKLMTELATSFYQQASQSVDKAKKDYDKANQVYQKNCEQHINPQTGLVEKLSLEQRLACNLGQISELDLPLEVETFYHNHLKQDLWEIAISDPNYFLKNSEILDRFNRPERYSFSVQVSLALLKDFLDWKTHYNGLKSQQAKTKFLKQLKSKLDKILSFMTPEQSEKDLYYLNKGFDELLVGLDKQTDNPATEESDKTSLTTNKASEK